MDERSRNGACHATDLPNLPDTESHVEGDASPLCHFLLSLVSPSPDRGVHGLLGGVGGGRGRREQILAEGVSRTGYVVNGQLQLIALWI